VDEAEQVGAAQEAELVRAAEEQEQVGAGKRTAEVRSGKDACAGLGEALQRISFFSELEAIVRIYVKKDGPRPSRLI
jgi:hypothetical protein